MNQPLSNVCPGCGQEKESEEQRYCGACTEEAARDLADNNAYDRMREERDE